MGRCVHVIDVPACAGDFECLIVITTIRRKVPQPTLCRFRSPPYAVVLRDKRNLIYTCLSPQSKEGSRSQHTVPLTFTTICGNIPSPLNMGWRVIVWIMQTVGGSFTTYPSPLQTLASALHGIWVSCFPSWGFMCSPAIASWMDLSDDLNMFMIFCFFLAQPDCPS